MSIESFQNSPWENLLFKKVHLSLTIVSTVCYSAVFISAYAQLWLILYLRHKLFSTQSIYFFLCCIFTSLRIVLFSMMYNYSPNQSLHKVTFWILMCLPSVFQYIIVLLITVFYYKTYIKSMGGPSTLSRNSTITVTVAVLLQLLLSFIPIWNQKCTKSAQNLSLTSIHIICSDLIFLATLSTFVHVYRQFPKFPNAMLVQEAKKITRVRSIIICCACLLGMAAKLIYDIISLFGCSTLFHIKLLSILQPSDFVDLNDDEEHFIIFGIVLFLWEIVPLVAVMILFRVQFPSGFFKNRFFGSSTNNTVMSYSRSHSTSMASNVPDRSRFVAIPNYGSSNPLLYSSDTPKRVPYYRNIDNKTPKRDWVDSGHRSCEPRSSLQTRQLVDSMRSDGYNLQNDSIRQGPVDSKRSILSNIWRSRSTQVLTKSSFKDQFHDPRVSSSRLPTANEE